MDLLFTFIISINVIDWILYFPPMKIEIKPPENENVESVHWNNKEGDTIEKNEIIGYFILENGSTSSIISSVDGTLSSTVHLEGDTYGVIEGCDHSELFHNMCAICGKKIMENQSEFISLVHNRPGFKIKPKDAMKVYEEEKNILLKKKKLSLVLDLDLTLLHTTGDERFKTEENLVEYRIQNKFHLTKCRPYLKEFFEMLKDLFEFHIFTHGVREYAVKIAKIIDPDGTLFQEKVLSREECPNERIKTLSDIFPSSNQNTVLIVDDNFTVWKNNWKNLILISPFNYFTENKLGKNKNGGGVQQDEQLLIIGSLLKDIHHQFFQQENANVQHILGSIQRNVFKDLNILFYGFDWRNKDIRDTQIGFISTHFGATIFDEYSPKVTHIVARNRFKEIEQYKGVFLVHESW
jgi:FCP1-like phosphatase family protein